jgi:hypothetical protein
MTMETTTISKKRLWTGRILSGIAAAFLLFDGALKLTRLPGVMEANAQLGYQAGTVAGIGILELACLAVYLLRSTSVLGALLLTGYLGGAIASQLRADNPLFSHVLFPTYVAALIWGGLYLRDTRLAIFLPRSRQERTVATAAINPASAGARS